MTKTSEPAHADYPHEPGRLYDCAACESRCHCTAGYAECVYVGQHNGQAYPATFDQWTAGSLPPRDDCSRVTTCPHMPKCRPAR
jgi:hypothetical protein